MCDLDSGPILGTRLLAVPEKAPHDLAEYLETVITDMDSLSTAFVMVYAKEWATRGKNGCTATSVNVDRGGSDLVDLYRHLLVALANKPRELLSNLLASLLVGRIESVANDSYFDAVYRQWEASTTVGDGAPPPT
jgi:hypothetical protein